MRENWKPTLSPSVLASGRSKEINPDLFGEVSSPRVGHSTGRGAGRSVDPGVDHLSNHVAVPQGTSISGATRSVTVASASDTPAFLDTDRQIYELRSQVSLLTEQLNKVIAAFNEMSKNFNSRFERNQNSIAQHEQHIGQIQQMGVREMQQKISDLQVRFGERKSIDMKIQEMVDRHNNVIHNFEVRLGQVQRLVAEKEAQFVAAQTALNDAKMEISRLKRL